MRSLGDGLWVHEDTIKLGAVELGLRMTIVRLANGDLWVHSPTKISGSLREQIGQFGKVGVLVAPSNGHNLFLMEWIEAYPDAAIFCSEGIPDKLPDLSGHQIMTNSAGSPWPEILEMQRLDGVPFFHECVFLHPPSRSLIVTDFVQNHRGVVHTGMAAVQNALMLKPLGFKDICLAPPLRFGFMIKDKPAFKAAVKKVLEWQFDRIIVTHGDIIQTDARDTLIRLCQRFS